MLQAAPPALIKCEILSFSYAKVGFITQQILNLLNIFYWQNSQTCSCICCSLDSPCKQLNTYIHTYQTHTDCFPFTHNTRTKAHKQPHIHNTYIKAVFYWDFFWKGGKMLRFFFNLIGHWFLQFNFIFCPRVFCFCFFIHEKKYSECKTGLTQKYQYFGIIPGIF